MTGQHLKVQPSGVAISCRPYQRARSGGEGSSQMLTCVIFRKKTITVPSIPIYFALCVLKSICQNNGKITFTLHYSAVPQGPTSNE